MPDCPQKLDKIREEAAAGKKFTDAQFDHDKEQEVMGDRVF